MIEQILNNHNYIMELIGAFLTGVVGPIIYLIVEKYLKKEKNKGRDIVKENIASVSLISNEIEEIRDEFKALFKNIPWSLYPRAFEHLMGGNGLFINDYKDPKIATYGLKEAAESVGTKSTYLIPLFTLDEKYIGNIGIDFVSKKKRLTKDEWEHLQIKAGRIAGYLSTSLVNNWT